MDPAQKKRTFMFIGGMIVAVMFVTSYLAFGNTGSNTTTTVATTTIAGKTYVVSGSSNAVIKSYAPNFRVSLTNSSASNIAAFNSTLSHLLSNGSITNLVPEGAGFAAYSGTLDTYQVYELLNSTAFGSNLSWNATARVSLPTNITLYYASTPLNVYAGNSTYPIGVKNIGAIGSNVSVNILASVYQKSSGLTTGYYVYNNNIEITAS